MNELEQAQQIIARLQTELGQAHEQITQLESELLSVQEAMGWE